MPKTSDLVQKTTLVAADEILIVDSAVVDPTSDEATKYVTEANFSAQVQDDLMSNDAVTTIASTDTIPLLASGENKIISEANLSAQVQADIIADDNTFTGANVFPNLNVGADNTVSGLYATAFGFDNRATEESAHAEGNNTRASGQSAHSEGSGTIASNYSSHSEGYQSHARLIAQHAQANGAFDNYGDAQFTRTLLKVVTSNATPTELLPIFILPADFIMACTVTINGSNSDGMAAGFYKRQAYIKNIGGATALIGSVQTIGTDIETGSIGGVAITADDTNDSLKVEVTGKADETIRWVCVIDALEVGH